MVLSKVRGVADSGTVHPLQLEVQTDLTEDRTDTIPRGIDNRHFGAIMCGKGPSIQPRFATLLPGPDTQNAPRLHILLHVAPLSGRLSLPRGGGIMTNQQQSGKLMWAVVLGVLLIVVLVLLRGGTLCNIDVLGIKVGFYCPGSSPGGASGGSPGSGGPISVSVLTPHNMKQGQSVLTHVEAKDPGSMPIQMADVAISIDGKFIGGGKTDAMGVYDHNWSAAFPPGPHVMDVEVKRAPVSGHATLNLQISP